jgi:hypothetical protein
MSAYLVNIIVFSFQGASIFGHSNEFSSLQVLLLTRTCVFQSYTCFGFLKKNGDVYSESMTFFARMRNYFIQNDPDAGQLGGPSADDATVFYYKLETAPFGGTALAIMRDNLNSEIICASHGRNIS